MGGKAQGKEGHYQSQYLVTKPNRNEFSNQRKMSRQSQGSQRSISRPSSVGASNRLPEQQKDFRKAYMGLVEKMYNEQGQQISGLLTEDELAQVEYHKKLSEKNFLERSMFYLKHRDEKMQKMAIEAANRPDDQCTFMPNMYNTVKKVDQMKPRDINRFLSDQERYLESRQQRQEQKLFKMQSMELMQIQVR